MASQRTVHPITPNGRQTGQSKSVQAGPSSDSTLTKRPSRIIKIKAEPEDVTEVPSSARKKPSLGKNVGLSNLR
jgi:hypothetical protein